MSPSHENLYHPAVTDISGPFGDIKLFPRYSTRLGKKPEIVGQLPKHAKIVRNGMMYKTILILNIYIYYIIYYYILLLYIIIIYYILYYIIL